MTTPPGVPSVKPDDHGNSALISLTVVPSVLTALGLFLIFYPDVTVDSVGFQLGVPVLVIGGFGLIVMMGVRALRQSFGLKPGGPGRGGLNQGGHSQHRGWAPPAPPQGPPRV